MKKPKPSKSRPVSDSVFQYVSQCHNVQAQKSALVMPDGARVSHELGNRPQTETTVGLGGWRCSQCRKPCKVSRSRKQTTFELQQ